MNAQSLMPITLNQHKGSLLGFRISMALIDDKLKDIKANGEKKQPQNASLTHV